MIIKSDYDIILNHILKDISDIGLEYNATYNSTYFGKLLEYNAWFEGDVVLIEDFYKNRKNTYTNYPIPVQTNMFWQTVKPEVRKVHDPLPSEIAEKWPSIIGSNGMQVHLDGKSNKKLDAIEKDLHLFRKLAKNIIWTAAFGGSYLKLNMVNNKLELDPVKPTNGLHIGEGKNRVYHFWEFIVKPKKKYVKLEMRLLGNSGNLIVFTKLFEITKGKSMVQVPLFTIPETEGMNEFVATDHKSHMVHYLPNRIGKQKFDVGSYGTSDLDGSLQYFDLIDEATSIDGDEVRQSRTIFGIPEDFFETDSYGNKRKFNWRITNYIKKKDDVEDTLQKIDQFVPKLDATIHRDRIIQKYTIKAIKNAGMSPHTLGYQENGWDGKDLRREREALTLKSREEKIKELRVFIEAVVSDIAAVNKINYRDMSINIPKYIRPDQKELMETWAVARNANIASIETIVKHVQMDYMTEEEQKVEVARIKEQDFLLANKEYANIGKPANSPAQPNAKQVAKPKK